MVADFRAGHVPHAGYDPDALGRVTVASRDAVFAYSMGVISGGEAILATTAVVAGEASRQMLRERAEAAATAAAARSRRPWKPETPREGGSPAG